MLKFDHGKSEKSVDQVKTEVQVPQYHEFQSPASRNDPSLIWVSENHVFLNFFKP